MAYFQFSLRVHPPHCPHLLCRYVLTRHVLAPEQGDVMGLRSSRRNLGLRLELLNTEK